MTPIQFSMHNKTLHFLRLLIVEGSMGQVIKEENVSNNFIERSNLTGLIFTKVACIKR